MVSMCAVLSLIGLAGPATSAVAVDGGRADAVAPADSGQDWTTWGYDVQRTGYNPNETTLSPTTVHGLHLLWSFPFPLKSDNAPVLATNVLVDGVPTNLIYAGDRTGTFHAVNADTGTEVWSRQLGTNATCAGVLGVTDTAVIDRSTNLLYVAGGDGQLYALDLATGADAPGWPLAITMFPNEYVWSAITEFDGSLYVAVASGCDALGTNYGRVVRVDPDTLTQTAAFYVDGWSEHGRLGRRHLGLGRRVDRPGGRQRLRGVRERLPGPPVRALPVRGEPRPPRRATSPSCRRTTPGCAGGTWTSGRRPYCSTHPTGADRRSRRRRRRAR